MTVVKKYPTAFDDEDSAWSNESDALGEDDGSCATTNLINKRLLLSGFGFDIPEGSTINSIKFGSHKVGYNTYGYGYGYLTVGVWFKQAVSPFSEQGCVGWGSDTTKACSDCVDQECTLVGFELSVDDLNNENFVFFARQDNGFLGIGNNMFLDSCWIEVDYTPPAPPAEGGILVQVM